MRHYYCREKQFLADIMTNILLENDHPIARSGFCQLISSDPELKKKFVVTVLDTADWSTIKPPQILLLAVNHKSNFSPFFAVLKKLRSKPKLIIHFDETEFDAVVQLLQFGVSGLVSQRSGTLELVNCLRQVSKNGSYICQRSAKKILTRFRIRQRKGR
jgi:DNA-binding NarL/FixJ family response regulator